MGSVRGAHTRTLFSLATAFLAPAVMLAACGSRGNQGLEPTIVEPTVRPTLASSAPPTMAPAENISIGKPADASASLPDQPPGNAVDGDVDTSWVAGGHPPQWIEIDLGAAFDIERLRLSVGQTPDGATVHRVLGGERQGETSLLHEFSGDTHEGQVLEAAPVPAWQRIRYLRIETTESPSWVAWREIEVYGTPAAEADQAPPSVIFHNGNLLTMDADQPSAQAIAVRGEVIAAVGTDADVLALAGPATLIVDLEGRTLTPGFIDSHSHRIPQRYKWGFERGEEAVQEALRQGWTGLSEAALNEDEWNELRDLADGGLLSIRVDAYLLFDTFEGDPLPEWYNAYRPGQMFGPTLRAAGLKFFIDFNSGRQLLFDLPGLADALRARRAEGWQVAMKAIGAESHELALDAIELAEGGENAQGARYRLEHALAQTAEQQNRMARMGVIGVIQPGLIGVVAHWPDIQALIAEQGAENMSNWRRMADAGVQMAGGPFNPDGVDDEYTTDSHMSPMGVIYRGVTQIGPGGRRPQPWMVEHALTVEEILRLLTMDAAYAIFQEDIRGSLTPGKLADLVILSADPRTAGVEDLLTIETLMTMVGGQMSWCAPGAEALCSGSQTSAPPTSGGDAVIPTWPILRAGSQGPEVAALQYLLRHHGHDIPADEHFGPVTKQAVEDFQSQKGLTVDGVVGGQTWTALVEGIVLQVGSSGEAVSAAQHLLLEKFGYAEIVVDGLFGRVTESAVKSFQESHGLTADGMIGAAQTWPALISIQP